jgi:membrane protein DedA with SNARE-associated domain
MFVQITSYIANYGYLALFCIVVFMELGVPGLPNEVVLFYFGYACRKAGLFFPAVLGTGVVADIAGSLLLYFLFFYGGYRLKR